METIKTSWQKVVLFVKDHKLLVIISSIFLVLILILVLILLFSGGGTPDDTASPGVTDPPAVQDPTDNPPVFGGDGSDDGSDDDPVDDGSDKTLTMWGAFLAEDDLLPLIEEFEADNPGVTIEYDAEIIDNSDIESYEARLEDVLTDSDNPNQPDIFVVDSGWSGKYREYSAPAPSSVISFNQFSSDFHDFVVTDFSDESNVYGVPLWVDTLALIYNEELWQDAGLDSPSSDWNTLLDEQIPAIIESLPDDSEVAAFSAGGLGNDEFSYELLNTLLLQNDIEVVEEGEVVLAADSDTADSVVSFYKELGTAGNWSADYNLDIAAFLEGDLATYIAPSWRLNDIERYNELGNLGLNYEVIELPQVGSSESQFAVFPNYWGYQVNSESNDPELAWEFLSFLTSEDSLELLNETIQDDPNDFVGIIYPLTSMTSQQSNDPLLSSYVQALDYTISWQAVDEIAVREVFLDLASGTIGISSASDELETIVSSTNGAAEQTTN